MNENIPDSVVEKIRKLLALATSDNQAEMERAMEKAVEYATKYNLNLSEIDIHNKQREEPIVKGEEIDFGKREPTVQKYIYNILIDHFNLRVVRSGNRYFNRKMVLIGRKMDIELGQYVNSYLNSEMPRLWQKYYSSTPGIRLDQKQAYLFGLAQGLSEKLAESRKTTEVEKFESIRESKGESEMAAVQNCYALTVKNTKEKLQEKVEEFYPNLKKSPRWSVNLNSHDAISDGKKAGRSISLNRPISNSNRQQIKA